MKKVLLIGSGGSRKSTLARDLSAKTGLPLIRLDALYWRPGWSATPGEEWAALVNRLTQGPSGSWTATTVEHLTVQPIRVFWTGPKSRRPVQTSGFNVELSAADGLIPLATQAVKFICTYKGDLLLIDELGLSSLIDLGLYNQATENHPWPSDQIPATLIQLPADLGASTELSFYGQPSGAA